MAWSQAGRQWTTRRSGLIRGRGGPNDASETASAPGPMKFDFCETKSARSSKMWWRERAAAARRPEPVPPSGIHCHGSYEARMSSRSPELQEEALRRRRLISAQACEIASLRASTSWRITPWAIRAVSSDSSWYRHIRSIPEATVVIRSRLSSDFWRLPTTAVDSLGPVKAGLVKRF
jgi:hypothetical protein